MKIKAIIAAICLAIPALTTSAAAWPAPEFSTAGNEHWYHLVFEQGDVVIQDVGDGQICSTRLPNATRTSQQWKLVGDAENFTLVSRDGNVATCSDYMRTSADASKASRFALRRSPKAAYADTWEVQALDKGDEYDRINCLGGIGQGRSIGFYTPGEAANALYFLDSEVVAASEIIPSKEVEFKVKGAESYTPVHRHTLWYTAPATAANVTNPWMEYALPIGNGQLGAMVYGGVRNDHLQFNEKTLWTGSPDLYGCYQNFGDLYIEDISDVFGTTDDKAVTDYVRALDMTDGIASASYTSPDGTVKYLREYISSYPDGVVAMRLSASQGGKISIRTKLYTGVRRGLLPVSYADGSMSFGSKLTLLDFKARAKVIPTGGTMTTNAADIEVRGADEVLIVLAAATNYDPVSPDYTSSADAMRTALDNRIDAAAAKGWDALLAAQRADHTALMGRSEFVIDGAANTATPEAMIKAYNGRKPDRLSPQSLMLEELYYAMGRYLMTGCSRGVDIPSNLQGIWNNSNAPAWNCDIHSNINVQMNYWPAENTNLSELHLPFLNYVYNMALVQPQWQEYARRSNQTKGWTCFTQNNIFGYSDYAENYVIANAWYADHLWEHYLYTLDTGFLRERALPVMTSCAEFWLERLITADDGTLVAPQEWSPEHGPAAEDGTAHAQQIIHRLFSSTIEAMDILGDTGALRDRLAETLDKLDPGLAVEKYTGAWGESCNGVTTGTEILREWKYSDFSVGENGHRHQSHLMALYPFDRITPESPYFTPAVNALRMRGDVSTGWSLGWRINLWARALDGNHAHKIIESALRHSSSYGQSNGAGGVYYNLLDSHAPFQIDGNFGYTAGVTEMLMQSHGGVLRLLPALPDNWAKGHINGLRARGNITVDQAWSAGRLRNARICTHSAGRLRINYPGIADMDVTDANGATVNVTAVDADNIELDAAEDGVYNIVNPDSGVQGHLAAAGLEISVTGGIARVNTADAAIEAYDVAGRRLAAVRGSALDLRDLTPGTVLIIRATTGSATAVCKAAL